MTGRVSAYATSDERVQAVLLGEALTNSEFVVLVADDEMRYHAVSAAACKLLGYDREELLGMHVPDVVEETDAADRYRLLAADGRQTGWVTLICKDGRRIEAGYEAYETRVAGMPYYYISRRTPR